MGARRDFVFDRDGDKCVYCEADQRGPTFRDKAPVRLTEDHILPSSRGGRTVRSNLVTCCNRCNNARGNTDIVVWLKSLNPHRGERAVRRVVRSLLSAWRDPELDALLKRIQDTFPYTR